MLAGPARNSPIIIGQCLTILLSPFKLLPQPFVVELVVCITEELINNILTFLFNGVLEIPGSKPSFVPSDPDSWNAFLLTPQV